VPPQWSADRARSTNTHEPEELWWTSFNDPEFDKLVRQAVDANLDLDEAKAARGVVRSQPLENPFGPKV
jgi:outer membrane protein TolC